MKEKRAARAEKVSSWATHFSNGEQVRGLFAFGDAGHSLISNKRRIEILHGYERSGSGLRRLLISLLEGLGGPPAGEDTRRPTTPEERAKLQQKSTKRTIGWIRACWHFGDWDSTAGQLLVASQPKSRSRFASYLAVTPTKLLVFHVLNATRSANFGSAAEANWTIPIQQLTWTRDSRDKLNDGGLQLGFADGSWMTLVAAAVHGFPDYGEVFPEILPRTQPIPPA